MPAVHRAAGSTRGKTILVVEDDAEARSAAKRILWSAGYSVLTAANGDEALESCRDRAGPIHLLVTDVVMPGLSGPDLAKELAEVIPGLKVVFMSGWADETMALHGALEPCITLVAKPFTAENPTREVGRALAEARTGSADAAPDRRAEEDRDDG